MKENDVSYQIRGAIFDVYNKLGPGLLESVYEKALTYELRKRGVRVDTQVGVPLVYDNELLDAQLRLDLLVENCVIIELKSVEEIKNVFYKQILTYLRLTNKKLGILVNFNTDNISTSIHRVVNNL